MQSCREKNFLSHLGHVTPRDRPLNGTNLTLPSRSNLNILTSHVLSHLISLGKTVLRDVISILSISSYIKSIPSISRDIKRITSILCYILSYVSSISIIIRGFLSILLYVLKKYFTWLETYFS